MGALGGRLPARRHVGAHGRAARSRCQAERAEGRQAPRAGGAAEPQSTAPKNGEEGCAIKGGGGTTGDVGMRSGAAPSLVASLRLAAGAAGRGEGWADGLSRGVSGVPLTPHVVVLPGCPVPSRAVGPRLSRGNVLGKQGLHGICIKQRCFQVQVRGAAAAAARTSGVCPQLLLASAYPISGLCPL